jgi:hypothetical protein
MLIQIRSLPKLVNQQAVFRPKMCPYLKYPRTPPMV